MYSFKTRVQLRHDGQCTWYAPTFIKTGFDFNSQWFPFDVQVCSLLFGSWTHNAWEIDIFPDRDSADLSFYLESEEFDLLSASTKRKVTKYS